MPVITFARRAVWRACGWTGAAVLAVLAVLSVEGVLVARDARRRREADVVAGFEALLRDVQGGQR